LAINAKNLCVKNGKFIVKATDVKCPQIFWMKSRHTEVWGQLFHLVPLHDASFLSGPWTMYYVCARL